MAYVLTKAETTHDFVKVMRDNGREVREIDPMLEHVLISGMFSAFFELLLHRESISDAEDYIRQLRAFFGIAAALIGFAMMC